MRAVSHSLSALAALIAAPVAVAALAARPTWRVGFGERLGRHPVQGRPPLWIHAASVGEMAAASRLVAEWIEDGEAAVLSTTTATARAVTRARFPGVPCHLAPLDHPWTAGAALRRVSPRALVLVETELWPVWIAEADRRGIPVVVVSGRLSDRAFPRYRRVAPLVGRTLRRIAAVGARSDVDAERFVALGARADTVRVTGDLKLDTPWKLQPLAEDLAAALGEVPLVVAGSTHPGEDEALLAALDALERAGTGAALVLAPRHSDRCEAVASLVRASGRRLLLRSKLAAERLRSGDVLVLDSVGELGAVYSRARFAFVGGTLSPVGGHNLLEPVFAGRPVYFGPHTENVRETSAILERSGAGRRVEDAAELATGLCRDFAASAASVEARVAAGRRALEPHRGAVTRSLALIRDNAATGARRS